MTLDSPDFWVALLQIIGVNIVLSGDNAVVIALAARSLPPDQQKKAVAWGSGAAVVMRIVLTIVAVELLRLPYLKLIGAVLLLWIALQLLLPEDDGEGEAQASSNLAAAIKTILIADLVMSLDNVIAVAAAAKGNLVLLIIGLAISIPLVVFASTLLLNLMTRYPMIITLGAALLGWVAGEMAITDPAVKAWIDANAGFLHIAAPLAGAIGVVIVGKALAARAERKHLDKSMAAVPTPEPMAAPAGRRLLLAVDGSQASNKAVQQAIELWRSTPKASDFDLHLVNVQASLPGDVSPFVPNPSLGGFHVEQADEALAPARAELDRAGVAYHVHRQVGDPAPTIAALADHLGCHEIVIGSRGHNAATTALIGSVAQRTVELSKIPVLVVR